MRVRSLLELAEDLLARTEIDRRPLALADALAARGDGSSVSIAEAAADLSSLLVRDRVLVVQGGLREDEFNGGWSLRLKAAWDYEQLCAQHAQRLSLRLDLRDPGAWQRVDAVLARHRPGPADHGCGPHVEVHGTREVA